MKTGARFFMSAFNKIDDCTAPTGRHSQQGRGPGRAQGWSPGEHRDRAAVWWAFSAWVPREAKEPSDGWPSGCVMAWAFQITSDTQFKNGILLARTDFQLQESWLVRRKSFWIMKHVASLGFLDSKYLGIRIPYKQVCNGKKKKRVLDDLPKKVGLFSNSKLFVVYYSF